jgi:hypothetical protein
MNNRMSVLLVLGTLGFTAACDSSNPNTPAAVSFTAPRAQGPSNSALFRFNDQPITLTIHNAARTGPATVTYTVELATSDAFSTIYRTIEGVAEGAGTTTTVTVGNLPGATTFFWRWRTVIDGVTGEASSPGSFFVRPQVILGVPDAEQPAANRDIYTPRPTFTVRNGTRTGPVGPITYTFEVSTVNTFATVVTRATGVAEGNVRTSWTPASDLPEATLYWRARAIDVENDEAGPWTTGIRFERKRGIDLTQVVYQWGANITNWAETSEITSAYHRDGQLCIFHTKLGIWPVQNFFDAGPILEGNQQIFALIGGTWYSGSADWYRPSQACKTVDNLIGPDSFPGANPIGNWRPQPGEIFGVMATTPARMWPYMKTLDERSNVVLIQW